MSSEHSGSSTAAKWIIVNTQANRDGLALRNLQRQGFETYAPQIRRRVCHARRRNDVLRPLFPGYLFVQLLPSRAWRPIVSTLGVRSVVRRGDFPSIVDERLISEIKAREKDGVVGPERPVLEIGQAVRLAEGPFEGIVGQIIELCEKDRLVVLMSLLNQTVRVKVSGDQLAACS